MEILINRRRLTNGLKIKKELPVFIHDDGSKSITVFNEDGTLKETRRVLFLPDGTNTLTIYDLDGVVTYKEHRDKCMNVIDALNNLIENGMNHCQQLITNRPKSR